MKKNLKSTNQRDAIMVELRKAGKHPSAEEIYLQVRKSYFGSALQQYIAILKFCPKMGSLINTSLVAA